MSVIDPENAGHYESNLKSFRTRWEGAIINWETRAGVLRGESMVVHYREWVYLLDWFGMNQVAVLEPKPGVPPTAGHLASLQDRLGREKALVIVRSPINNPAPSEWLSNRTDLALLVLPHMVGSTEKARDLFFLFEEIVSSLLRGKS